MFGVLMLMLFSGNPLIFLFFASLFLLATAYEWAALILPEKYYSSFAYAAVIFIEVCFLFQYADQYYVIFSIVGWGSALLFMLVQPRPLPQANHAHRLFLSLLGLLLLPAFALAIKSIFFKSEPIMVLNLFILIASHDTGAYFSGNRWGKKKIAPFLSPNKTYMGAMGGLGLTLAAALLLGTLRSEPLYQWMIYGTVIAIFAFIGDLFESLIKRLNRKKDSGHILPGHGGVLDRLDSAIACAPFFAYLIQIF